VGTLRIVPSQAHGSVFIVRDFWCEVDATGAGGEKSRSGSGAGSVMGAGACATGMGCGCTGVRTTAGRIAGCWRTGAGA